jgi:purine-nucleoside phosphorylase
VVGDLAGVRVAVFAGRYHVYQGLSACEAAYPALLGHALGADTLLTTNASGAVREGLSAGDLVLLSDHINLSGVTPLTGWPGPQGGTPFLPMAGAYDAELAALAVRAAGDHGIPLARNGVYAFVTGPSYETAAEVAALGTLGADVVGMSTVPEVLAARALGMRVLALSLVANAAGAHALSHADVVDVSRAAGERLGELVIAILQRLV